jgi:ATP-dependent DNA helicase DinG
MTQALGWLEDDGVGRLLHLRHRTRERMRAALNHLLEECLFLREMEVCMGAPERTASFQRYARHWVLQSAPVDVADAIRTAFYGGTRGMVYTAATLRYEGRFDLFSGIVGLDRPFFLDETGEKKRETRFAVIPSPFDGGNRTIVVSPDAVNGKKQQQIRWLDSVCRTIPELVDANGGRTMVLFASYSDLETVASRIGDRIEALGYPLLVPASGAADGGFV